MEIDPKFADLINAEIDGWISPEEHVELEAYLAENDTAGAYRDELVGLCEGLDLIEPVSPPPHLKHVILDAFIASKPARQAPRQRVSKDLFNDFFGVPVVRYAMSFAAGVILAYTLLSSEELSRQALDDVTNLVGTITQPESAGDIGTADSIQLALNELAGSVSLKKLGDMLIIDFDLTSEGPVDIVAAFSDPDIWFNGFAQLESSGTSVAADNGRVTLHMEGQRRYALYLHDTGDGTATVNLRFYANGKLVHEGDLVFGDDN
jgi:hypothetical protein